jgi:hypothetical protein
MWAAGSQRLRALSPSRGEFPHARTAFVWGRTVCCRVAWRRPRSVRAVNRGAACGQLLPATWCRMVPPRPWLVRRLGANVTMTSAPLVFLFV